MKGEGKSKEKVKQEDTWLYLYWLYTLYPVPLAVEINCSDVVLKSQESQTLSSLEYHHYFVILINYLVTSALQSLTDLSEPRDPVATSGNKSLTQVIWNIFQLNLSNIFHERHKPETDVPSSLWSVCNHENSKSWELRLDRKWPNIFHLHQCQWCSPRDRIQIVVGRCLLDPGEEIRW